MASAAAPLPVEVVPVELYCLKCRKVQGVKPNTMHKELMKIKTKSGKEHFRNTWIGVCSVCEKPVRRFAVSDGPKVEKVKKSKKAVKPDVIPAAPVAL